MSDRLREAIGHTESRRLRDPIVYRSHDLEVLAAARRFLALTETGPDYEAAVKAIDAHLSNRLRGNGGIWLVDPRAIAKAIVDAAFADYLTEEE